MLSNKVKPAMVEAVSKMDHAGWMAINLARTKRVGARCMW